MQRICFSFQDVSGFHLLILSVLVVKKFHSSHKPRNLRGINLFAWTMVILLISNQPWIRLRIELEASSLTSSLDIEVAKSESVREQRLHCLHGTRLLRKLRMKRRIDSSRRKPPSRSRLVILIFPISWMEPRTACVPCVDIRRLPLFGNESDNAGCSDVCDWESLSRLL